MSKYLAWPMVIGVALLAGHAALSGIVFTALADRVYGIAGAVTSLAAGFAWAFVSFIFFWDMLLPIARGGTPFRSATGAAQLFVAPNWVWILGFTLLGLVTSACYRALRATPVREAGREQRRLNHTPLHRAA